LNDSDEFAIRKQIIENDKVEAIIVLPRDMFYTTDISVTLWILNQNKKAGTLNSRTLRDRQGETLFIDLRTWNDNIEEIVIDKKKKKKKTILSDNQIAKVKAIYNAWQDEDTSQYNDVAELCKGADLDEIRANNYNLAPSKYIEFIDRDLDIDYEQEMSRIQAEMRDVIKREKKSQTMLEKAFRGIGYDID
ncbi:MAG: N-6 DNA methylase, partial [Moraxellaceae bacterium]|nr:N-6 DNA methylase [Moraxellaceae bacterium]